MARALLSRSLIPKRLPPTLTSLAATKTGQNDFNNKIFSREMSTSKKLSNSPEFLSFLGDVDPEQKQMIKKILNFKMIGGKSTKVRNIVYDTFRRIARNDRDVIKLVSAAVENTKPICEVVKVGVAGTVYDVPGIVGRDRQQALAVRWIFGAALKRRESSRKTSLEKCLFAEILDAYRKKGVAHKRKETVHGLASMNRSFAHFRWW